MNVKNNILSGKDLVEKLNPELKERIEQTKKKMNVAKNPKLVIISTSEDAASKIYMNNKIKAGKEIGVDVEIRQIKDIFDFDHKNNISIQLKKTIRELNGFDSVDGIIVQLPLPENIDPKPIMNMIDPDKDVDGFSNTTRHLSCTPMGIMKLLDEYNVEVSGKHVVIINRSDIVGRPLAKMMIDKNATVTVAHSRTPYFDILLNLISNADIIVSATGIPGFLKAGQLKTDAVVVDVSINRNEDGKLVGDFDIDSLSVTNRNKIVATGLPTPIRYTPVPNGVGKTTVWALMSNVVDSWTNRLEIIKRRGEGLK